MPLNQSGNNFQRTYLLVNDSKKILSRSRRGVMKQMICTFSGISTGLSEIFLPFEFKKYVKKLAIGISRSLLAVTDQVGSCGASSIEDLQETQTQAFKDRTTTRLNSSHV